MSYVLRSENRIQQKMEKYINAYKPTRLRIKAGIEDLAQEPPKGDIKALQGYIDGRKLVLAWDPDYTKLASVEMVELEKTGKSIAVDGTIPHDAINCLNFVTITWHLIKINPGLTMVFTGFILVNTRFKKKEKNQKKELN